MRQQQNDRTTEPGNDGTRESNRKREQLNKGMLERRKQQNEGTDKVME
jgi:hypothetical protein